MRKADTSQHDSLNRTLPKTENNEKRKYKNKTN